MLSDLLREHLISHDAGGGDGGGVGGDGLTTAGSDQLVRGLTLKLDCLPLTSKQTPAF